MFHNHNLPISSPLIPDSTVSDQLMERLMQPKPNLRSKYLRNSMSKFRGEGVLPYMGYTGMCGPKGRGFSVILVINRGRFGHFGLK